MRRTLLLTATALGIWSFGYGPFLPWSPVRPGFAAVTEGRVTVVYPEKWLLPGALRAPGALLAEAERFHRLPATRDVVIFISPDWETAYRVLPRLARRGVGAVTLSTGNAIYLLPTVAEQRLDPEEFIRHEMSHAILHQNQSLPDAVRLREVQWLAEGIAVWFGRQKAYLSREEFLLLAPSRDVAAYLDPAIGVPEADALDIRFRYACWREFNRYLAAPDPDRYWGFVHAAIRDPRQWRAIFAERLQMPFDSAIAAFARSLATAP